MLVSSEDLELNGLVCYHAQQSAEKALKGLLAAAEQEIEKTHDLVRLLDLCASLGLPMEPLIPSATLLTPFATQSRYPGLGPCPTAQQAKEALSAAEGVLATVLQFIPA